MFSQSCLFYFNLFYAPFIIPFNITNHNRTAFDIVSVYFFFNHFHNNFIFSQILTRILDTYLDLFLNKLESQRLLIIYFVRKS